MGQNLTKINILDQVQVTRLAVADAAATPTKRQGVVAFTSLTATRNVTLPAASDFPPDMPMVIADESGNCSASVKITITPAGNDTILGAGSAINLTRPYQRVSLYSDGTGKWTINGVLDEVINNLVTSGPLATALNAKSNRGRRAINDVNIAVVPTDAVIAYSAITATRAVVLPSAANFPVGQPLTIVDESGNCSPTLKILISAANSETVLGLANISISRPYQTVTIYSNGTNKWLADGAADELNSGKTVISAGSQRSLTMGIWLKRLDDFGGLTAVSWLADMGYSVPLNGVDDDGAGIQKYINDVGACKLFNNGRFINLKANGLVWEGPNGVIMGGSPEDSIICRSLALQTVETVTINYPKSGNVTTARGVACVRFGSRTDASKNAGRCTFSGIRWYHDGRLLPLGNDGTGSLAGRLQNREAMLEVWGGSANIERCQDGGAQYTYAIYGGDNTYITKCRALTQIWDRRNVNMQEGHAIVLLAHGGVHGAGTSFWSRDCEFYGGAATNQQTYTTQDGDGAAQSVAPSASNVAYTSTRRSGPLYIWEIQSREDWYILDCFSAAADRDNIHIAAALIDDILLNGAIVGGDHDESNGSNIMVTRSDPSMARMTRLKIANVNLNGQLIGRRAITTDCSSAASPCVSTLEISNVQTTAHVGNAMRLNGALGGHLKDSNICGYNNANNDYSAGAPAPEVCGVDIGAQTSYFRTEDVTFYGGVNGASDANKAQIGYMDETTNQANTFNNLKSYNLGKTPNIPILGGTQFVGDTKQ